MVRSIQRGSDRFVVLRFYRSTVVFTVDDLVSDGCGFNPLEFVCRAAAVLGTTRISAIEKSARRGFVDVCVYGAEALASFDRGPDSGDQSVLDDPDCDHVFRRKADADSVVGHRNCVARVLAFHFSGAS